MKPALPPKLPASEVQWELLIPAPIHEPRGMPSCSKHLIATALNLPRWMQSYFFDEVWGRLAPTLQARRFQMKTRNVLFICAAGALFASLGMVGCSSSDGGLPEGTGGKKTGGTTGAGGSHGAGGSKGTGGSSGGTHVQGTGGSVGGMGGATTVRRPDAGPATPRDAGPFEQREVGATGIGRGDAGAIERREAGGTRVERDAGVIERREAGGAGIARREVGP